MLIIFLFNVGGYYLAFWALEYKTDKALSVRIDQDLYDAAETITIKVPIALPYPIQEHDYERVDGTFEFQGEYYKLVKQKLEKDTLYVVCLKNHEQKEMVETITTYVKLTNDLPGNAKKALSFFGKFLKDYDSVSRAEVIPATSWHHEISFKELNTYLQSTSQEIHSPPPES
jgi:hypothetical protein